MSYNQNEKEKLKKDIYEILVGGEYSYKSDEKIIEIIKELNERRKYFKHRLIDQLPEDIKKDIYELKVQLGIEKSEWKIRGNSASRWAPNGLKFESCILPLNFEIDKMEIISIDEIEGKIYFDYPTDKEKSERKKHWIYIELYDFLNNEKRVLEHKEIKDFKIDSIKTWEDMKDYIVTKGFSPKGYMREMGEFLLNLKGDTFYVDEIDKSIGFKSRKTRRFYCLKFIDLGLIEDGEKKGIYRKKFDVS